MEYTILLQTKLVYFDTVIIKDTVALLSVREDSEYKRTLKTNKD